MSDQHQTPHERIELLRDIAKNGYRSVSLGTRTDPNGKRRTNRVLVDSFTASAVVQVYDALNETNKAKFATLDLLRMVDVTWKVIGRANKGTA